jgi:hypothetical protein
MQEEERDLQLDSEDKDLSEDEPMVAGEENKECAEAANDLVTLPPESEPEDENSSVVDVLGYGPSKKPPLVEPRVDHSDARKKHTELDPGTGARLQTKSGVQEDR